jgi:hypothetical protein
MLLEKKSYHLKIKNNNYVKNKDKTLTNDTIYL